MATTLVRTTGSHSEGTSVAAVSVDRAYRHSAILDGVPSLTKGKVRGMSETKFFSIEEFEGGAFVSPLQTVRSFADEQVRGEWEKLLEILTEADAKKIAVDLSQLSFFGSTMLEWIVLLGKHVKAHGGHLVICCANGPTLEVLKIAKFDTLYPIIETRELAKARLAELS